MQKKHAIPPHRPSRKRGPTNTYGPGVTTATGGETVFPADRGKRRRR